MNVPELPELTCHSLGPELWAAWSPELVEGRLRARVTRVLAEVGQRVERGAPLAELYSPELSEAETGYVTVIAELEAHERELQRTEKLVDLGAASRQELERLRAELAALQDGPVGP